MAKGKKPRAKKKHGPPANPPIPNGANRRAMAVVTHKLANDLRDLDEKIALLNKQKKNRIDQYKKDTSRSVRATKRALAFFKMEDTVARTTEINDQADIMQDLGMMDAGLFKQAGLEAGWAADKVREQSTPGFIHGLGQQAFKDGRKFDDHGYPAEAVTEIDMWQRGFHAAQKAKEEADWQKAEDAKRAKAAKAKPAAAESEAGPEPGTKPH